MPFLFCPGTNPFPGGISGVYAEYTHKEALNTIFFIFLRRIYIDTGRDIFRCKKKHSGNKKWTRKIV
jgi:hypothetical protein